MCIVSAMDNHSYRDEDLVPIGVASALLAVSPSTVRRYEDQGKITAVRTLGNQRRYRVGDLRAAMSGRGAA